ncbi:MAG: deoxyribodipyrimidine photo-lyase [Candidatus Sericytochromatia bacterium]|nr:deoxyribodipyrimidine photo-lyase [Candidatus Tanganyikabacteria bacterium]
MTVHLVWFRDACRIADHPALLAAARAGRVVPAMVDDPEAPTGGAKAWWQERQAEALDRDLAALGSPLVRRRGAAVPTLTGLARESGACVVHVTRALDPAGSRAQALLARELERVGIRMERHGGQTLWEPETVSTGSGSPYRVFTPFWKACALREAPPRPVPAPVRLLPPETLLPSDPEACRMRRPVHPWTEKLAAAWSPDECTGQHQLAAFAAERVRAYAAKRDLPAEPGTSSLSPWLANGGISVRQAWWTAMDACAGQPDSGTETWLRELGWREFAWHLLHHFPHTCEQPLDPRFRDFPWRDAPEELRAWQQGRTGFPVVDAGMRQLWQTGWMHNRVRMIVASFLVKDLLLPWQEGARWFMDTLVDADLASNTLGWQWAAGCGADAAPFFRIFNPTTQARKFDPDGVYIGRWVPELANVPMPWRHEPDSAPPLAASGTYPRHIVDHGAARRRALALLAERSAARS